MAAITLNPTHHARQIRERLEAVLTVLRETLDAFVSSRIRQAAGEAEQAHPIRSISAP